ncbi:hypothetical protein [Xenorhabdus sp. BG5]|nr:hypothetical protein [Xenorhabdus sp. BG5]MBE8596513.1 hypothetical protein [Xenorhabdus sp. BG5]
MDLLGQDSKRFIDNLFWVGFAISANIPRWHFSLLIIPYRLRLHAPN